jgi:hypothetical protein
MNNQTASAFADSYKSCYEQIYSYHAQSLFHYNVLRF